MAAVVTASASAVACQARGRGAGRLLTGGLDRQAHGWSGSVQLRHASPRFSQVGQPDATAARTELTAAAGPARALCLPAVCSCGVATTHVAFGSCNPLAAGPPTRPAASASAAAAWRAC